ALRRTSLHMASRSAVRPRRWSNASARHLSTSTCAGCSTCPTVWFTGSSAGAFFSCRQDRVRTEVPYTGSVTHAAGVHGHIDDLVFHLGRLAGIGIRQQEGATCTALLAAAIALLPLTSLPLSDDIGALTVGAVQHLDDPCASP